MTFFQQRFLFFQEPIIIVKADKDLISLTVMKIELQFQAYNSSKILDAGAGADEWEHATALYSCHGVFVDRFIFGSNFPGMRLPWECHGLSQESNLTSFDYLFTAKGGFATKLWPLRL